MSWLTVPPAATRHGLDDLGWPGDALLQDGAWRPVAAGEQVHGVAVSPRWESTSTPESGGLLPELEEGLQAPDGAPLAEVPRRFTVRAPDDAQSC